ncbi:uncharacterized protein LOC128241515 [Mya arenaria]|uniref:uncharacterized protein LOC128241515 n=1 Tax=Mya arenaria TaxID=6604 RepID=UPI0022E2316A|nr:uncharacterized protein LOC128241515 [Mya arenaria]XP_052814439.1 uncharacterized protein LOC128241515 [Mya arenaria]XP_052814440.1 uncharacterized protein LOC128241515 [Mya arenaria]XP_052814441.1 uncharacterized protein LOC128241515 [Mya arenaria]
MSEALEDSRAWSLRVSRALNDIGVTRRIVARRRRTWLRIEAVNTLLCTLVGSDRTTYFFGSQSEGTTTLGMKSDVDILYSKTKHAVLLDWREWQMGKFNFLVKKTEGSPPQHCYLQRLRLDCPLPMTEVFDHENVIDCEGNVFVRNDVGDNSLQTQAGVKLISHGPSRSFGDDVDMVSAYQCARLPAECQFLFYRPRPGHWPTSDMLVQASQFPVFLVKQGYPDSPYHQRLLEWRFSTSLMERLLVFSFNIIQIKVYVLLKMIRKSFLKQFVGDNLSTFHIKTAMMFTIESYPPDIWREENIVQCALYCMTTLFRWLKLGYCPHFTISGVNLFVGKLGKPELHTLLSVVADIMCDNLSCITLIQMDELGARLQPVTRAFPGKSRHEINMEICGRMCRQFCSTHQYFLFEFPNGIVTLSNLYNNFSRLNILNDMLREPSFEKEASTIILRFVANKLASALASEKLRLNQPITGDIMQVYCLSFESDLLSSRLKFASMLYCSGQYEAAASVLSYCEGLLGPHVWQHCACGRVHKPSRAFLVKCLKTENDLEFHKKSVASCIIFTHLETWVVPDHLLYEMCRKTTSEDAFIMDSELQWMKYVVIDCIPFLYYLQYLTYRELDQPDRKHTALQNLNNYLCNPGGVSGHVETVTNVLGHCYELENRPDMFWQCYTQSLHNHPRNNAANWHVMRLLNQQARQR